MPNTWFSNYIIEYNRDSIKYNITLTKSCTNIVENFIP